MEKELKDLRQFYINTLTQAGYTKIDLKNTSTKELGDIYYKELKKVVNDIKLINQCS
jgi:hypothetical protein